VAALPAGHLRGGHPAPKVPPTDEALRGCGLRGEQEQVPSLLWSGALLPCPGPGSGSGKGEAEGQETGDPGLSQASAGGAQGGATSSQSSACETQQCH